jgi:prophage antirepressor-like protein
MTELTVFAFESSAVRSLMIDGEPWFVAADIAAVLGYRNAPDMARMLDDDEKGTQIVRTLGGDQEFTIINESGVYACVLKSRRPEAKPFRKWVTSEVLPTLRKTGRYEMPASPDPDPGNRISNPAFVTPQHEADMAVAADRMFRAFVRAGKSAGLREREAVSAAGEIALQVTGIDILKLLNKPKGPPQPRLTQAQEFIEDWKSGRTEAAYEYMEYRDFYAVYRAWCEARGLERCGFYEFPDAFVSRARDVDKGLRYAPGGDLWRNAQENTQPSSNHDG